MTSATYTLTHSYLGQLTNVSGTTSTGTESASYGYDLRGRLTSESRSRVIGGTTYSGSGSYSYDLSDNLNAGGNGWVYNLDNQLTSAPSAGGLPGATGITYGTSGLNKGAITAMNGDTFSYDAWGSLSSMTKSGVSGSITITYDPLGRRFSRTDQSGNTSYYDYDGDQLIGEQTGGAVSTGYTGYYAGVDGYLGSAGAGAGGSATYYQYDPEGDLRSVLANPGTVLWNLQNGYDQWGNPQEGPAGYTAPPTPFRQDGAYRDPATGYLAIANAGMGANYSPNVADAVDDTDQLMTAGSWGQMYGRAGSLGWGNLHKLPSWQAGSPERQFESQTLGTLCFPYYAYTLASGNDPVAGRCLSKGERLFGGLMLAMAAVGHLPGGGRRAIPRQLNLDFPDLPPPVPKNQWHHPFPKYLGGEEAQPLVELPEWYHSLIHDELDKTLPRWRGKAFYNLLRMANPARFRERVWRDLSQVYAQYPLTDHPTTGNPFRWTGQGM